MRKQLLKQSLIITTIGTILILLGTLTGTAQTTTTTEAVYNDSHAYTRLETHEYTANMSLQPGTYQLQYNFTSTQPIDKFYVIILDPDSYEVNSTRAPPATYQTPMKLAFQAQENGQYTMILGGTWITVQISLTKVMQTTKIVYPYEIALYIGIALFTIGVPLSLIGASINEKRQQQWYD